MVKKFFTVVTREIRGLHEAAYVLAFFAFLSQLLALVRDRLLAYSFGAGHELDIYYAAFRIPDFIFIFVGSLVSASILLPFFIESFSKSQEDGKKFADSIFTIFFSIILLIAVLAFIFANTLVPLVLPGFANDPLLGDLILMMRIMLLSPIFLSLSNLFASLTQMRYRFMVYAISPLLYNIGIIVGILIFYNIFGLYGLAIGVALGAFLHMAIQVPPLLRERMLPVFTNNLHWQNIRSVVLTAMPRTVTLSVNELARFIFISVASFFAAGSISVFNLAFNLQSVPLSLIGVSYSSAVFPALSKLFYDKNMQGFLDKMVTASRHIIFWSMPITILFIVLRAQIVRTVLGAGKFDWVDTRITAAMLALFIISTVGQSLILLFVRAFYAEGKTARPLIINIISAVSIVIMGFGFTYIFEHVEMFRFFMEDLFRVGGLPGTKVLMLALAFTIGTTINAILHWIMFERSYPGFTKPVMETFFHSFSASVIAGFFAFMSLRILALVLPLSKVWGIFLQGFIAGIVGLIVGAGVLYAMKNRELEEVWNTLHQKIWKARVPPAEVERM